MIKILVFRVGEEPKVETVENPFQFAQQSVLGGADIEAKNFFVGDHRVVFYWDDDATRKKLPMNRHVPVIAPRLGQYNFVVDMRKGDPDSYAKPGELGYFPLRGNFIVTMADSQGDHVSLPQEVITELVDNIKLLLCEHCKKQPIGYPGARFCGAACSAEHEMHIEP